MRRNFAVQVEDLTVSYGNKIAVWDVDMEVPTGVLMAIVGPNGAGKSTFLKSMVDLIKPLAGSIKIFGQPYKFQKKVVGYIPQRQSVDWDFPASVLDVVLMGTYGDLGWFKRPGKREQKIGMRMLEKVGMHELCYRQISQLSGGQQQRVFLARALAQNPDIFLMDEPFQGVDAATEKTIVGVLKELKRQGKSILVVHHDLQSVIEYFDWVAMINVRMIGYGEIKNVFTEENLRLAYGGILSFSAHPFSSHPSQREDNFA